MRLRRARCLILAVVDHPPSFQRIRAGCPEASPVSRGGAAPAGRGAGELAFRHGVRRSRRRFAGSFVVAPPWRRERDPDAAAAMARAPAAGTFTWFLRRRD